MWVLWWTLGTCGCCDGGGTCGCYGGHWGLVGVVMVVGHVGVMVDTGDLWVL